MSMGPAMLFGHLAATAVSAIVLARGERFVWMLAEALGMRALPVVHGTTLAIARRAPLPTHSYRSLRDVCLTYSQTLRGPPISNA
jgi:hypothetical protein